MLSQSPKVQRFFFIRYQIQVVVYIYALRKGNMCYSFGYGSTCNVMGVETMKIKMFDRMVHILG